MWKDAPRRVAPRRGRPSGRRGGSRVGRYVSAGRRVQELVVPKGGGRTDGFTP